ADQPVNGVKEMEKAAKKFAAKTQ
ncbi:MAG: hypothetical protein JWR18_853, partial [Segetibacter sp.]|nr:hypothetical protein [Segetibacter sp.]